MPRLSWVVLVLLTACAQDRSSELAAPPVPSTVPANATTRSTAPVPPFIDELAWLEELLAHRPRIVMMHDGSVSDPAWQALVLRPRYRALFLASPADTYESIVAREYTSAQRESDATWADALRDAQRAFAPTATVAPAGYPLNAYVGYRVGPAEPRTPPDDLVVSYKAFLEFADFQRSLSPDRYAGFVARLASSGFRGDSKIDLRPGQVRFQYNNLIVHAPSIDQALCAEAVGIEYFGAEIDHIARGVDAVVGRETRNWHHFLLTGRYEELRDPVKAFIEYRTPVAPVSICPNG